MTKPLTIRAAFERHYDKTDLRPSSIQAIKAAILCWERCTPNPDVREITNETVAAWKQAALESGKKPRTVNGYWTTLRSVLRRVGPPHDRNPFGLGIIERVPAMKLCKVPLVRPKRVPLEDLSKVYVAARHMRRPQRGIPQPGTWWQCLLAFAFYTGLRSGDILKARWEDVDVERGTLYVKISKTRLETDYPLHPVVLAHLSRMGRNDERIFSIDRAYLYSLWPQLIEQAGVPRFGLHDIRRTGISEIDAVDRGMGQTFALHAPRNVTERSYLNSLPELPGAIEKMASPLAFRHGIKMTDRAVKKVQEQFRSADEFLPPIHPPPGAFVFRTDGFFFRGKFHLMAGCSLSILRTLVEHDCCCTQAELWAATDVEPFTKAKDARKRLFARLKDARTALRKRLGLPEGFNPIPATSRYRRGDLAQYELFLPPALLEERKGGAA